MLRVPNAALRYEPGAFSDAADAGVGAQRAPRARRDRDHDEGDGGAPHVRRGTIYVLRNGSPERVRVRIGLVDESLTEVSAEGLSEHAQVIVDEIAPTASERAPGAAFGGAPQRGGSRGGGGGRTR